MVPKTHFQHTCFAAVGRRLNGVGVSLKARPSISRAVKLTQVIVAAVVLLVGLDIDTLVLVSSASSTAAVTAAGGAPDGSSAAASAAALCATSAAASSRSASEAVMGAGGAAVPASSGGRYLLRSILVYNG